MHPHCAPIVTALAVVITVGIVAEATRLCPGRKPLAERR